MKIENKQRLKSTMIALVAFLIGSNSLFGQDALTSVRYIVKNFTLSADQKEISYDVYLKDIDVNSVIAVPGYTFRMAVPTSDLGSNAKIVKVSNGTSEIGAGYATMNLTGDSWLMKFNQSNMALKYENSLIVSDLGDGTLLGTFHIRNEDGSCFVNLNTFNATFSGTSIRNKSTVAILKPNTIRLAVNSTTALRSSSITGLGTTAIDKIGSETFYLYPNLTSEGFYVNNGNQEHNLNIYDLKGSRVYSQSIVGESYINVSSLMSGIYMVEVNGIYKKVIKK